MHTKVINAQTISASQSFTSKGITIPSNHGDFSLYWEVSGDGTAKFEYEASADGQHFILDDTSSIVADQTKTSGPGSDGKDMVNFAPWPAEAIKIKCTETGTSNSITVSAWLIST